MAAGLQVFDASGKLVVDSTRSLMNYIGSFTLIGSTTAAVGSNNNTPQSGWGPTTINIPQFSQGIPWYALFPSPPPVLPMNLDWIASMIVFPQITLSSTGITWKYPNRSFTTTASWLFGGAMVVYGIR